MDYLVIHGAYILIICQSLWLLMVEFQLTVIEVFISEGGFGYVRSMYYVLEEAVFLDFL